MKRPLALLVACVIAISLFSISAVAETIEFPPESVASITSFDPNINSKGIIYVGGTFVVEDYWWDKTSTYYDHSLIRFDTSALPRNIVIKKAYLNICLYFFTYDLNYPPFGVSVLARGIANDWDENKVTWSTKPALYNDLAYTGSTTVVNETGKYYSWDVTRLASAWHSKTKANHGIHLSSIVPYESYALHFTSPLSNDPYYSKQPKLVVEYQLLPPPPARPAPPTVAPKAKVFLTRLSFGAKPKTVKKGRRTALYGQLTSATSAANRTIFSRTALSRKIVVIKERVVSKARKKRKARYRKVYLKYRSLYRKTKNKTLRKRYQRRANKYKKAYKKTKTVFYKTIKRARTNSRGKFKTKIRVKRNMLLKAFFGRTASYKKSKSKLLRVKVKKAKKKKRKK